MQHLARHFLAEGLVQSLQARHVPRKRRNFIGNREQSHGQSIDGWYRQRRVGAHHRPREKLGVPARR
jgi:hypothetical protein